MAALSGSAARFVRGTSAYIPRAGTFEMAPPNQPANYSAPAHINDDASALGGPVRERLALGLFEEQTPNAGVMVGYHAAAAV